MYEAFYNLSAEPFRLSPDPRFCFGHKSYAKAKAYMQYAAQRGEGFIMITGFPGTGKTTLIEDLLAGLPEDSVLSAKLSSAQVEADDLLRMVAYTFGLSVEGLDKASVLQRIEKFLVRQVQNGRRGLLIIDEAQALSRDALEELRLLSNMQANARPLLQVFLVGQQNLRDVMREPGMEQLHQRLIASCHLQPLSAKETRAYVGHRLRCAAWNGDPGISGGALLLIYRFSQGVPRRINLMVSRLLLHGSVEQKHELRGEDARIVIEELRDESLLPVGEADTSGADFAIPSDLDAIDAADVGADLLPIPAVKQLSAGEPYLIELSVESDGHAYALNPGKTYVGRVPGCDVVLRDKFTSRKHAELELRPDGRLVMRDLGSRNGTWVNGQRVDEYSLCDGDRIQFGSKLVYQIRIPPGVAAAHTADAVPGKAGREGRARSASHAGVPPPLRVNNSIRSGEEIGGAEKGAGEPDGEAVPVAETLVMPGAGDENTALNLDLRDSTEATRSAASSANVVPRTADTSRPKPSGDAGPQNLGPRGERRAEGRAPAEGTARVVVGRSNTLPQESDDAVLKSMEQARRDEIAAPSHELGQGVAETGMIPASRKDDPLVTRKASRLSGTPLAFYWFLFMAAIAGLYAANSDSLEPVRTELRSWVALGVEQFRGLVSADAPRHETGAPPGSVGGSEGDVLGRKTLPGQADSELPGPARPLKADPS